MGEPIFVSMLTAGIVIQTFPGRAGEVEHQLAVIPEMRVQSRAENRVTGVCTIASGRALASFLDRVRAQSPGIASIETTFVSE